MAGSLLSAVKMLGRVILYDVIANITGTVFESWEKNNNINNKLSDYEGNKDHYESTFQEPPHKKVEST